VAQWLATDGTLHFHRITLRWSPADPFAVRLRFPGQIDWYTSRELIFDALAKPGITGEGDLRLATDLDKADCLVLELRNKKRSTTMRIRCKVLGSFLAATISHECADPTAELDTWLASGAAGHRRKK
jgi:hypothetical protein